MSSNPGTNPWITLERLRYWQGQTLLSRDFNDQAAFDELLRDWHNRALHNAYGVIKGLEVTVRQGNRLAVQPGIAYDAVGHLLWLADGVWLDLPDPLSAPLPAGGLLLVIRWPGQPEAEPGACGEACLPALPPRNLPVRFALLAEGLFDPRRDGVALARILPGPMLDSGFTRRYGRASARPRVGSGATLPGATPWNLWRRDKSDFESEVEPAAKDYLPTGEDRQILLTEETRARIATGQPPRPVETSQILGLEVDVNTSGAGFTTTPRYLAWLEGDLWNPDLLAMIEAQAQKDQRKERPSGQSATLIDGLILLQMIQVRFGHIYRPTMGGFTYRVWFPQINKWALGAPVFQYLVLLAQAQRLTVAWMGIEENKGRSSRIETSALAADHRRKE